MSIFRSTFKPFVVRQLNARQFLLKQGDNTTSRPIQVQQYALSKSPWIRMVSFVNYDSPDKKYSGDQLARKYILQAGTLVSDVDGRLSLRSGIGNPGGSYGSPNIGNRQLGLRPMPGITAVTEQSAGAYGSLQQVQVEYYCHDKKQLDELEILFMRPGYTVLVEWGWSLYMDTAIGGGETYATESDPNSLKQTDVKIKQVLDKNGWIKPFDQPTINPFDATKTHDDIYNEINTLKHKYSGNYDGVIGYIRNFTWEALPDGGYKCISFIVSLGDVLDSIKMNRATTIQQVEQEKKTGGYNNNFTRLMDRLLTPGVAGNELTELFRILNGDPLLDFKVIPLPGVKQPIVNAGSEQSANLSFMKFIQFGLFIGIINKYFNLYDNRKKPMIDIEIPVYNTKNIGNGLCLASVDSVSIDPTVCILRNPKAEFVTGLPGIGYDPCKTMGAANMKEYLLPGTSLGIIGNIYLNINRAKDIFSEMMAENPTDGVTMYKYITRVLSEISASLGGINDFDVFVYDNKAAIIDKNYVEIPDKSDKASKYQMSWFGNDSIVRNHKMISKIFQSQANMIAISAGVRENITGVQNSTYVYLNQGMTNRLRPSVTEVENAGNNDSEEQIKKEKETLAGTVLELQKYLKGFLNDKNINSLLTDTPNMSTLLQSILLQVNVDTNYRSIIPICLDVTIDGISGIFPNQVFTVNTDMLPTEWARKDVGFIATSVSQKIVPGDWTTTIGTQMCLLDQNKVQVKAKTINIEDKKKEILLGVYSSIQGTIKNNSKGVDAYNALLPFIKAYYENAIEVNMVLQGVRESQTIVLKGYDVKQLTTDVFVSGPSAIIGQLNLLDLTGVFKSTKGYSDSDISKNADDIGLKTIQLDYGLTFATQGQRISNETKIDNIIKKGIDGSVKILNPLLRHSLFSTTDPVAIKKLLLDLVKSTTEFTSMPPIGSSKLLSTIDKIHSSIFDNGAGQVNIFYAQGTFSEFGDLLTISDDPKRPLTITNTIYRKIKQDYNVLSNK